MELLQHPSLEEMKNVQPQGPSRSAMCEGDLHPSRKAGPASPVKQQPQKTKRAQRDASNCPIPAFYDYLPAPVVDALVERYSQPVPGVEGLRVVGPLQEDAAFAQRYGGASLDLLCPEALRYAVELYRASLEFSPNLASLLEHRKMKRECLAEAAKEASRTGEQLRDVPLKDGTVALGYREDTSGIREDPSWKVADIPPRFARFHDTITGPPKANIIANALKSGVHFFMVDFEDSATVARESLLEGLTAVTLANRRQLDYRSAKGKRYTVLPEEDVQMAEMILRFEGLHLPNGHFLVDGHPMPAHLMTIALYLFHNWSTLKNENRAPAFYIPKLETFEEALYLAKLFETSEKLLREHTSDQDIKVGTIQCLAIIENVGAAYQKEEILYALRNYIIGLNCGWHDYMASIGAAHQNLPRFSMPPKSNLRIVVEHLEAYQMGIVDVCKRRGAIPIGGMNAMVPPTIGSENSMERIVEAFSQDFRVQVGRGLEGCWLAHPQLVPVIQELITEMELERKAESESERENRIAKLQEGIKKITHERMLVTNLEEVFCTEEEFERNLSDALQYLTSYITGEGCVGLTTKFKDGVRVRLMEDAATLERSRREIWSIVNYQKEIISRSGQKARMTASQLEDHLRNVMQQIKFGEGEEAADIPFTAETKNAYDIALSIVRSLCTDPKPVEYFTALTSKYLLYPFRNNPALLERYLQSTQSHLSFLAEYPKIDISEAKILFVSDETFAEAANLLKNNFPRFEPHSFGNQGQVYDGWESTRHNMNPPDIAVIELPKYCKIYGVNIDTAHFDGNHAPGAKLECLKEHIVNRRKIAEWVTAVPCSVLKPNSRNYFPTITAEDQSSSASEGCPWTRFIRLCSYPDGGIARLELYGEELEDSLEQPRRRSDSDDARIDLQLKQAWRQTLNFNNGFPADFVPPKNPKIELSKTKKKKASETSTTLTEVLPSSFNFPELTELACGSDAQVVASSSAHYSLPGNMLKPGRGINMGDGWETARLRPAQPDEIFTMKGPLSSVWNWTVVRLHRSGHIVTVGIDTLHFKNNSPVAFSLEGCLAPEGLDGDDFHRASYFTLIPPTLLHPHQEHVFEVMEEARHKTCTHALLKIYPCGGISRLRLFGLPSPAGLTKRR